MTTQAPSTQNSATRPAPASTFKPRVRRLGAGRYLIESATTPGIGHTATATACSCKGASFGHMCRHMTLVAALEPRFQAWYAQRESQAAPVVAPATAPDAHLDEAEGRLASAHRALADTDPRDDSYAVLLRAVDQAERQVAALSSSALRAA
jgi:hypothetical protein